MAQGEGLRSASASCNTHTSHHDVLASSFSSSFLRLSWSRTHAASTLFFWHDRGESALVFFSIIRQHRYEKRHSARLHLCVSLMFLCNEILVNSSLTHRSNQRTSDSIE